MSNSRYLVIPSLVFMIAVFTIGAFSIDLWVSDLLYYLEGGHWALRNTWLTENVLHTGGRELSVFFALMMIPLIVISSFVERLKPYRIGFVYLLLTAVIGTLIVSSLKSLTHRDCPWDLLRYGGLKPRLSYFSYMLHTGINNGKCFPAGHASAGYCWFGLYFFAKKYKPEWRLAGLILPLSLGLIFGIDQQLRGAHFLSHDLWSAWICWVSAVALSFMLEKPLSLRYPKSAISRSTQADYD